MIYLSACHVSFDVVSTVKENIYGLDPVDLQREAVRSTYYIELMQCGGRWVIVGSAMRGITFYGH